MKPKRIKTLFTFLLPVFILLQPALLPLLFSDELPEGIKLRVGGYENKPKIYTDARGRRTGFHIDLLEYIAQEEGWEIEYVWGSWEDGLQWLLNAQLDIMPDVAISEERKKLFAFNEEVVLVNWARIYTARDKKAETFLCLENKKIAVMSESIHTEGAGGIKELARSFDISCEFIEVPDYQAVFELLHRREADLGIVNRTFGNANEDNYRVHRTPIIFNPTDIRFAFPPQAELTPKLLEAIDYHMRELKKQPRSKYYHYLEKYFGISVEESPLPRWLLNTLYSFIALVLLLGGILYLCRRLIGKQTEKIRQTHTEVMDRLTAILEYKETAAVRHTNMVSTVAYLVGREMGLSNKKCNNLKKSTSMHDIGKIAIKDNILLKPGKLTEEEREQMKEHTTNGARMLANGKSEVIRMAESIALYHHERWDGQGYPGGLKGKQIPQPARICKVADVFNALVSERPYKKAWPLKKAVDEISRKRGSSFDPAVVDAFFKVLPRIKKDFDLS